MRLDVDSVNPFVPPSVVNTNTPLNPGLSGPQDYLRSGVDAAQSGDKTTARAMFLRSSELNPNDPNVWLWLASISEYPEELMGFVEKVLDLDPYNERALQWRTATCGLLAKTFVQRGSDAAEADQPMYAEDCFAKALQYDPKNTSAMMWLASLTKDEDARIEFLDRIIELDPEHQAAKTALANISVEKEKSEFDEIRRVAADGNVASAVALLDGFTESYPNNQDSWMLLSHLSSEPSVKMSALDRVLEIDPEHSVARASLDSLVSLFGVRNFAEPAAEPEPSQFEMALEEPVAPVAELFDDAPIAPPQEQLMIDSESAHQAVDPFESFAEHLVAEPVEVLEVRSEDLAAPQEVEVLVEAEEPVKDFAVPEWQEGSNESENDWDRKTEAYSVEDINVSELLPEYTAVEEDVDEEPFSIPMPEVELTEESIQPERTGFETTVQAAPEADVPSTMSCPYCSAANDQTAFTCRSCSAVLTLADLESLIDNKNADTYLIRRAVDAMESERSSREFSEAELTTLGIGHLNLRNLQFGFDRLQEASRLNPDNIVLSSHVNSLLIRIDEIRRQEEVHANMSTGKNILVVDDSPTIRKLIAGKLEKSGHNVHLCEDGEMALEFIKTNVPDLVLLDIKMPGLDGYDVCRQLRGWNSSANVPIVMISGKDGYFDRVRGRMAGSTGYITKPFGPETLMKAVEFYLGGGSDMEEEAGDAAVEIEEYELAVAD